MTQIINTLKLTIVTSGSAGSATGNAITAVPGGITGLLYSVYIKPNATGWAATTDITVTEEGAETAGRTLLTLTDKSSAAVSYPLRVAEVGAIGAATGGYALVALNGGQIKIALAQANAQSPALEAWLYLLR